MSKNKKKRIFKKKNSSITRDKDGVPQAEPPRNKSLMGRTVAPDTEGKAYLEKEKVLAQVEILLLKGVITPTSVAVTLSITFITAKKYIEQVHYRWAALGTSTRVKQVKGEAKARLNLINQEIWTLYSNSGDQKIKAMCLSQLTNVHDRMLILEGLTPQTIPILLARESQSVDAVSTKLDNHKKLVGLASGLIEYCNVRQEPEILEGEFTETKD